MELDIEKLRKETEESLSRNTYILIGLLVFGVTGLTLFVAFAPESTAEERLVLLSIPRTPTDFSELIRVVKAYTVSSHYYVMSAFCFLYLFLQSFGIPGPLILSIISGALFGRLLGLVLVTICSTVGAFSCYLISETFGKGWVVRNFPTMIVQTHKRLAPHRSDLFFYLLFLRLTPILPNWFINMASPILGISKSVFLFASLLGLIPANLLYINSGLMLSTVQEIGLDYQSLLFLLFLGALALLPTFLRKTIKLKE